MASYCVKKRFSYRRSVFVCRNIDSYIIKEERVGSG